MKSTMILPCGVSRAANRACPGASAVMSAVTRPCRKLRADSPVTLTTPRSERIAVCICVPSKALDGIEYLGLFLPALRWRLAIDFIRFFGSTLPEAYHFVNISRVKQNADETFPRRN